MRNSSRILPLEFVWLSCHVVDLELLSMAKRTPAPVACCIITSMLVKSSYVFRFMSNYILAQIILPLSLTASSTTMSSFEICLSNKKSI